MTKEECIALLNRYAEYNGMGIPNLAGCREAMRTAAELLQHPSLPSNLDEAAEEYEKNKVYSISALGTNKDGFAYYMRTGTSFSDAFKAGAEWMAGQGVSMQITDDTEWANVDSFIHKNVTGETIIQIRKK